jgi:DUF971 family protein
MLDVRRETLKPQKIHLHKQSKTLEIVFNETTYLLPAEFLRTHSPSAEVRGHGVGQEVLVFGKIDVGIESVKPVGNYGLQIDFNDGHNSGIFSWSYLLTLGKDQTTLWHAYLEKLKTEDKNRDPHTVVIQFPPA